MKRRLIPLLFALSIAALSSTPIWTNWFTKLGANKLSLGLAVIGFVFKAALFFMMRRRMLDPDRRLTLFGRSLVDYFFSLIVLDFVMAGVFATLYMLTVYRQATPQWLTLANRSAINGAVALIVATGVAVAWEMHKSGDLQVHEDPLGTEEAMGSTPERRSGLDRRRGWGRMV